MTVAENVGLGTGYPRRFGLIDWSAANDTARRVMARVGCDIDPGRRVFSLTRAEKSLLAIGRALEVKARLLVLDEPSASLPMSDVERMFGVLRELRRQGMAMLYVSHRLDEVLAISDRAAVMRDGKLVAVKDTAQTNEGELVGLIVGKAPSASVQKAKAPEPGSSEPVLQLDGAASGNAGPLSLAVHRGEVLGPSACAARATRPSAARSSAASRCRPAACDCSATHVPSRVPPTPSAPAWPPLPASALKKTLPVR